LSADPIHDHDGKHRRATNRAAAATSNMSGHIMGQLRTANKRHNRAIVARQAVKSAKAAPAPAVKPVKAAA
jgi:hypothetical protein